MQAKNNWLEASVERPASETHVFADSILEERVCPLEACFPRATQHFRRCESSQNAFNALLVVHLGELRTLKSILGTNIGDAILQHIRNVLAMHALAENSVASKSGDDEIIILLQKIGETHAAAVAGATAASMQITRALDQFRIGSGYCRQGPISIGIAVFSDCGADNPLQQASLAMLHSKAIGTSAISHYNDEMLRAAVKKIELVADLQKALSNREFRVAYQPQVDSNGNPIGAEALIRWMHPLKGEILPGEFIPCAENSGLIPSIGKWVLTEACEQLSRWAGNENFQHLSISVNVSAIQLKNNDFISEVKSILKNTGANPCMLKLEITESFFISNTGSVAIGLRHLTSIGIKISMDDFGTGYASFSSLRLIPFNQIKIDRVFVTDILNSEVDSSIVNSIISLARTLKIEVMAEGVETIHQFHALKKMGCRYFQGYFFTPPMNIDGLNSWIMNQTARLVPAALP